MEGSSSADASEGWDTASYNFMVRGDEATARAIFYKGRPFPGEEGYGLYCASVTITAARRFGRLTFGTAHFLGIKGGVSGTIVRRERRGANLTTREVSSDALASEYGVAEGQFVITAPNGRPVDLVRLHGLQGYAERQLVTTVPPPSAMSFGTLDAQAPNLSLSPVQALDWLGTQHVYNYPSGLLCSSCQYEQHPAGVALWLVDLRWERIGEYEMT